MVALRSFLSLTAAILTASHSFVTAANVIDLEHSLKRDTPSKVPTGRTALLRPAIDLDVNIYDYKSLTPSRQHKFYYATQDKKTGRVHQAWVNYKFHHPLVALDHTAYIWHTRCFGPGGRNMLVQFSNQKAYNKALAWGKQMPMILSGYWHRGCKPADKDAERYFAMATKVERRPGTRELRYYVRFMTVAEVAKDMEINFGHPDGVKTTGTTEWNPPATTSYPAHATSTTLRSITPASVPTSMPIASPIPPATTSLIPTVTLPSTDIPVQTSAPIVLPPPISTTTPAPTPAPTAVTPVEDNDDVPSTPYPFIPPALPTPETPDNTLEDFDAALDNKIGFFRDFGDTFNQQVFPGVDISSSSDSKRSLHGWEDEGDVDDCADENCDIAELLRRDGEKMRRRGLGSFLGKVVKAATKAVVAAVSKPLQVARAVVNTATAIVKLPLKAVSAVLNKIVPPISLTPLNTDWNWTLPPKALQAQKQVKSPFGKAIKFFQWGEQQKSSSGKASKGGKLTTSSKAGMAAYCVNCQIQGQFHVTGTLKVQPLGLLVQQAQIKMTGPMVMNNEIGVEFWGNLNMQFKEQIFSVPIQGFKIPGIVDIGPKFELDVYSKLAVAVDGQVSFGQKSTWNKDFTILLDLLSPGESSVSNYDHTVEPKMQMAAAFSLSIERGVQIGFPLKLSFFGGKLEFSAGLWAATGTQSVLEYRSGVVDITRRDPILSIRGTDSYPLSEEELIYEQAYKDGVPPVDDISRLIHTYSPTSRELAPYHSPYGERGLVPRARKGVKSSKDCPVGMLIAVYDKKSVFFQAKLIGKKTIWDASKPIALWCSTDDDAMPKVTQTKTPTLPAATSTTRPDPDPVTPTSTPTVDLATTTTAPVLQSTTTSCSGKTNGNFTLPNGAIYQIQCGVAFFGSDIIYPSASSFDQCLALCENYNAQHGGGCQSISWVPQTPGAVAEGWKACSLKNDVPPASPFDKWEVDSAVLISGGRSCSGLAAQTYTATNGRSFDPKCGEIWPNVNNIIQYTAVDSFQQCIDTCANRADCVSVVYFNSGNCWLHDLTPTSSYPASGYASAVITSSLAARDEEAAITGENKDGQASADDSDADSFSGFELPMPDPADLVEPDPDFVQSFVESAFSALAAAPDNTNDNAAAYNSTSTDIEDASVPDDGSAGTSPQNSDDPGSTLPSTSGLTRIQNVDGSVFGFATQSGNLMLQLASNDTSSSGDGGIDTGSFFQTTSTTDPTANLYSDYGGRMMHIYQDELLQYNVSRIRLSKQDGIPLTSLFVTLTPLGALSQIAGDQANTLVAVTTKGVIYYLSACIYESNLAFAKIFVIKDNMRGDATLESGGLQTVVTGGAVRSCSMVQLQSKPL